jgi:hypothetical protein
MPLIRQIDFRCGSALPTLIESRACGRGRSESGEAGKRKQPHLRGAGRLLPIPFANTVLKSAAARG